MSNQHQTNSSAMPTMQKLTAGKTFKPLCAAIVSLVTLSVITAAKPAHAFGVTYNFTVQITSDAYEAQGLLNGMTEQGSLTYDDANLTGIGSEYVSGAQGNLILQFNFLNKVYTERNDLNYGNNSYLYDYPAAFFTNGTLLGLDFLVVPSQLQPPQDAPGFRIFNNGFYAGATDNFNSGTLVGMVAYGIPAIGSEPTDPDDRTAAVPEPSEVGGAIVALSVWGVWARRKVK